MARHFLDVRRTLCPMPVIRTQDRVGGLVPGEILEVVSTDPAALVDIPTWAKINGHRIVQTYREGFDVFVVIQVGAS